MKFIIEINCDNSAFKDDAATEICRILEVLAEQAHVLKWCSNRDQIPITDMNGNRVGFAKFMDNNSKA